MTLSVFDIFKIGIGPSSSHTMGPMRAARAFVLDLERDGLLGETAEIAVRLYGSLALTGAGHGTDRAVLLGLEGNDPETIDPERIETELARIRTSGRLRLAGRHEIAFDEPMQLLFMKHERLPAHSNGMRFTALAKGGRKLREEDYYSVGGGFIVRGEDVPSPASGTPSPASGTLSPAERGRGLVEGARVPKAGEGGVPYPFNSGEQLLQQARAAGLEIYELVLANEHTRRSPEEVRAGLARIWQTMQACVERGFRQQGTLPGVLKVRRRAPKLYRVLSESEETTPLEVMDWVNVYALAVNEENAAGGRVVTAPTN
ncbi:MAG: serine dehydratase beta chain, partial [Steroidobacteraceae bacterium]